MAITFSYLAAHLLNTGGFSPVCEEAATKNCFNSFFECLASFSIQMAQLHHSPFYGLGISSWRQIALAAYL